MFRNVFISIFVLLIFSCEDAVDQGVELSEGEFDQEESVLTSVLRSNIQVSLDSVYQDTLIFEEFQDEYDYWYAVFQLDDTSLIYLAFNQYIPDQLKGSKLLVEWKMSEFYQAGEGDSSYYAEEMLSYTIVEEHTSFDGFLRDFVKSYSRVDDDLIWDYVHPEVGLHSAFNPGAMCIEEKVTALNLTPFINWDCTIEASYPEGDFCEGYAGADEGFYYESINAPELPKFADVSGDEYVPYTPELKLADEVEEYMQVLVISSEWNYRYLTFFKHNGKWFFWIEDLCDCSA